MLGMRMAVPYSVIGVIVGEFTSSTQGLGLFIHEASSTYDPAGVFAGIVILLAFVVVANVLAGRLERRFFRWETPAPPAPPGIFNPCTYNKSEAAFALGPHPAALPLPGLC